MMKKALGTGALGLLAAGLIFTSVTIAQAKSDNGGGVKSNCQEAHDKAITNGNGNHYGLIKHDNCPPK